MNLARWILKNGRCMPDRPAISAGGSAEHAEQEFARANTHVFSYRYGKVLKTELRERYNIHQLQNDFRT